MRSLLRKFLPSPPPKSRDDDDGFIVDYSFAEEYSGPPLDYTIPKAAPIDVDQIPTVSVAFMAPMVSNLSLPVIQPVVKRDTLSKKLGSGGGVPPNAVTQSAGFGGSGALASSDGRDNSCRSEDEKDNLGSLDSIDGPEGMTKAPDPIESSGTLGFSDSINDSQELSGSSEVEDLKGDGRESWDLNESGSPASYCTEGDCIDESPSQENGTLNAVNYCRSVFSDEIYDETDNEEPQFMRERPMCRTDLKKGLCHRCLKGNRFVEKEVCFVCCAKYCGNCVLRAMGSMPEGRKCITCIGFSIDESKRGALGNPSWVLKRLLTVSEVKRIMHCEISSEVNQLPSHLVYVNGKPLCHEEFAILQSCTNPPKKLKPGKYWYDKVSGFWGKEGQKPWQIISAHLAVGDAIMENASNGNTNILVNNREITKAELWMLQWAGVQCEGSPHFWVSADGSCQLEGQKNELCRIWEQPGIKMVCALLSLPTSELAIPSGRELDNLANGAVPDGFQQKTINKLLLVGYDKSGTSTIFKQAKIVYNVPFSEDEHQNIKFMIQSKLYGYLGILLEGREHFEEEYIIEMRNKLINQPGPSGISKLIDEGNVYSISSRLKAFSDWLLQVMMSGNLDIIFPAATREYAPFVEELWKDRAFQATYNRRNEIYALPRVANYFLNRAVEISKPDYEPSEVDILYAEGITSSNGLSSMEFSFPKSTQDGFTDPAEENDNLLSCRYQIIRVHSSSLGGNCKWLEMFEDIDLVMYSVDLTDYDEILEDGNGGSTNKMLVSKKLFESIVTHPTFERKNFLLILNKLDLLEEKIEQVPLTQCDWFDDFNPVISLHPSSSKNNSSLAQCACQYIAVKFKRLFHSLTGRKLYVSQVTALEPDSVDEAFRYAREILKWEVEKPSISINEPSSSSIDASTSS